MRFKGVSANASALVLFLCASYMPTANAESNLPSVDHAYTIETDLQSLLQDTSLSQEKELTEILAWYQNLYSQGSCVQMAAMNLIPECKLLNNPSDFAKAHPELYLDDVRVEYTVKLALCEIVGAQPDRPVAPKHCEAFIPSAEACIKRSWYWRRNHQPPTQHLPCYPEATKKNLHQCLKTFQETNQYWASYSNAHGRVVNMCQLSRHAIERERTLQLHKNMTYATFRVQSSLRGMQSDLRAFQSEFKQSTDGVKHSADHFKQFAEEARREAQQDREQTKHEIQTFQVEMATVHEMVISNISAYNARFDEAIYGSITKAIAAVREGQTDALTSISADLDSFYRGLKAEGLQLAAAMNAEIQQHHEKALLALQIEHGAMMQSYSIMTDSLVDVNQKVYAINEKVDVFANKMDLLDDRLDGLRTKLKAIERAFRLLDVLFSFRTIYLIAVVVTLRFCATSIPGRAFQSFTWYVLALPVWGSFLYLFGPYGFFEKFEEPSDYLTIEPSFSIASYIQASPAIFWAILAVICFLLAAYLPKINSFCERLRDRIAALPDTLYSSLWLAREQGIQGNTPAALGSQMLSGVRATSQEPRLALRPPISYEDQAPRTRLESFQRAQTVG